MMATYSIKKKLYECLRAIPFKSTWEGERHFFYFSVGCGGETIFFYVGWGGGLLKINSVGRGVFND
jgi:hypothetical protein